MGVVAVTVVVFATVAGRRRCGGSVGHGGGGSRGYLLVIISQ